MLCEVGRTVDQPHQLHDPANSVEAPEVVHKRGQNREPHEPGCRLAGIHIQVVTDPSREERAVGPERQVAGDESLLSDDEARLVGARRLTDRRQHETERGEPLLRRFREIHARLQTRESETRPVSPGLSGMPKPTKRTTGGVSEPSEVYWATGKLRGRPAVDQPGFITHTLSRVLE